MAEAHKVKEPVLPPSLEPVLPPSLEPVLPPTLETVVETVEPELTGEGPYRVRHKVNGGEFEVSAEYLAMYRETLELL